MMKAKEIKNWTEQNERFGLNYITSFAIIGNYRFEIRYDYDGQPSKKPDCGLVMTINSRGKYLYALFSNSIPELKKWAQEFLDTEVAYFIENYIEKK